MSTPAPTTKRVKLHQLPAPKTYYRAREEDSTTFVVVSNDLSQRNVSWLVSAKEIFSKQLPKMKKDYIVSLVFDGRHQTLLCFDGQAVVGGIAFKPFHAKRFAEIAFCAVSDMVQVRGFGARLMTHMKEYCKRVGIFHFLTYADNHAIGYFQKQGFSSDISLAREVYIRDIKNYEDSLLMECVVLAKVDYFATRALVQEQRQRLVERIGRGSGAQVAAHGFDVAYANHTDEDHLVIADAYNTIPGLREAGWRAPLLPDLVLPVDDDDDTCAASTLMSAAAVPTTKHACKQLVGQLEAAAAATTAVAVDKKATTQAVLLQVWEFVNRLDDAWPFYEPVPSSLTQYFEEIADPMDLSLIRDKIVHGAYDAEDGNGQQAAAAAESSKAKLLRDLVLMCQNCKQFNPVDTVYYKAAESLQQVVKDILG